jgi:hypothetical protein
MPADPQGDREVDLTGVVSLCLTENNAGGNPLGEIVHDEAGEDFLYDVRHCFRVKSRPGAFTNSHGEADASGFTSQPEL